MPLIQFEVEDESLDVNKYAASAVPVGNNTSPVEPGDYLVIFESIVEKTYQAQYKGDGLKHTYLSYRPSLRLVNEVGTVISFQDFTLGVIDENRKPKVMEAGRSAVHGGPRGALSMLVALGVMTGTSGKFNAAFAPEAIRNQVTAAWIGLSAWKKGEKGELEFSTLKRTLEQYIGKEPRTLEDFQVGLSIYNQTLGLTDSSETWKLKNAVIMFKIPNAAMAAKNGFYQSPDGRFWVDEQDYHNCLAAYEALRQPVKPNPMGKPSFGKPMSKKL